MVRREGQLQDLAPARRGLLRADALGSGSSDQPVHGEGEGPRATERPFLPPGFGPQGALQPGASLCSSWPCRLQLRGNAGIS